MNDAEAFDNPLYAYECELEDFNDCGFKQIEVLDKKYNKVGYILFDYETAFPQNLMSRNKSNSAEIVRLEVLEVKFEAAK